MGIKKTKLLIYSLVREIYVKFPFLVRCREAQIRARKSLSSIRRGLSYSAQNSAARESLIIGRDQIWGSPAIVTPVLNIDITAVTFNSGEWVEGFLISLMAQDFPISRVNIVFVDHGSTDDTLNKLMFWQREVGCDFASFKLIEQNNSGFGAGHNRAIRETDSDFILVTNVDLKFNKESIETVLRFALGDAENIAAWELRQLPFEHPKHYDPVTLETNWQSHACVLLRRDAYILVGGYEPKIFMYGEDVELSYRFRSFGYRLRYVPSASVQHFCYKSESQLSKPLQYTGSTLANAIIRLRYGQTWDRFFAFMALGLLIFRPNPPFKGLRKVSFKHFVFLLKNVRYFIKGQGPCTGIFPFRGLDYEVRREGANFMSKLPKQTAVVTIITRTYDAPGPLKLLQNCGRTVMNQTYRNIQWVIVQDGVGEMRNVATELASYMPWVDILFLEVEKKGRSNAGNCGLAAATGDYCLFLDDDDLIYSDHVEILVSTLSDDPTATAAYALSLESCVRVSEGRRVEGPYIYSSVFYQQWCFDTLLHHNFMPIQAVMFDRRIFLSRGGFDTNLDQLEDWNLWLRYGFNNRFIFVPKATSIFFTPCDSRERLSRHQDLHASYDKAKLAAVECFLGAEIE